jgi:hypothetical protein
MTLLFRCLNPAQKFRITKHQIAKFLRIPESQIVKIESWLYIVFVHRLDRGGQFISYRQMNNGKMLLPVNCKNAPPINNYNTCGMQLHTTTQSTTNNTPIPSFLS